MPMPVDRSRRLSRHYALGDFLVDSTFPDLALRLEPSTDVLVNLGRLASALDRLVERFPPSFEVLSGYRDESLNEACRNAGLPASLGSLHLSGCAADVRPTNEEIDSEAVWEWIRSNAESLPIHEAVCYPKKGIIHIAVVNYDVPTPKRILMRT